MLIVVLLASACGTVGTPAPLTDDQLKNGSYELQDIGAFQLTGGRYEKKYGEGATQVNRVGLQVVAFGDLNKDGAEDAVTILWANTGGSGTFIYLVALTNQKGTPKQAAAVLLGDRVQVKALVIAEGMVRVTTLSHGPNDPLCCPTQETTRTYQLQGNALKAM